MPNKLQLAAQRRRKQQEVPAPVITPIGIPEEFIRYESIDEPSTIGGLHHGGGLLTDNPIPLWKRLDATRRLISSYEHIIELTTKLLEPANAPEPPNNCYTLTNEDRLRMSEHVTANYQHNISFYTNLLETAKRRLAYLEALKTPDTFTDIEEEEEEEE